MSCDAAASDGALLVRAQDIVKRFGTRAALSGVDLAVRRGEIVTLIGPNGAGKTTLLRILLGLERPDSGTVERKPGLRIGYMPQRITIDALLPLTVRRFLALAHTSRPGAIEAALGEVGAGHVIESPIQGISGGELRRVLLARALLRNPELLVLDEPVQGVDVVGQDELFRLIFDIRHRRGCGVLMVSHELHLVMAATDTVVCLNHHVCCMGRPEAVSRHPEYLALFGGAGERMLALYTHHHDHVHDAEGHVVHLHGPGDGHAHGTGPDRPAAGGGHG